MTKVLKYGSDCSGIEAPYIALSELIGTMVDIDHKFSCDNDPNVREMISVNFSPQIIYEDVFTRDQDDVPEVDIYTAGFPCQTFSTAGKRDGFGDDRGIVFFAILDYIILKRPKIVILENVKGLLTHDIGNSFKTIVSSLEDIGIYNIYWEVLSPHEHGWPQYRPRVFIVCIIKDIQNRDFKFPKKKELTILASDLLDDHHIIKNPDLSDFELKNLEEHSYNIWQKYGHNISDHYYFFDIGASPAFGRPRYEIVPCLKASRSNYYVSKLGRKLMISEIENIQGFGKGINIIEDDRLEQVVSESKYKKMLGNSICVPIMIELYKAIFKSVNIQKLLSP